MVSVAILIAIVVLGWFFKRQVQGVLLNVRKKVERKIPLDAKIDRALHDMDGKKEKLGEALQDTYKAKAGITQQLEKTARNQKSGLYEFVFPEGSETRGKLENTLEKLQKRGNDIINAGKRIDVSAGELKIKQSYIAAMETVKGLDLKGMELEVDDIFAEVQAVEDMMSDFDL
jgi:hypothetical protein